MWSLKSSPQASDICARLHTYSMMQWVTLRLEKVATCLEEWFCLECCFIPRRKNVHIFCHSLRGKLVNGYEKYFLSFAPGSFAFSFQTYLPSLWPSHATHKTESLTATDILLYTIMYCQVISGNITMNSCLLTYVSFQICCETPSCFNESLCMC